MANPIKITFDGTEYTLEYSRRTVKQMERAGVQISAKAIDEEPVTAVENLFVGAFLMHHKNIKQEQTDRIWSGIENKEDIIADILQALEKAEA